MARIRTVFAIVLLLSSLPYLRAQVLTSTTVDAPISTPPQASVPTHSETPDAVSTPAAATAKVDEPLPPPIKAEPEHGLKELTGRLKEIAQRYDVSRIGSRKIGSGVNFYSIDKETALGRDLAMQVESESKIVRDPVINEYVNRIGQRLVRNSDAKVPFTIKVVDNDEVNAFALPGGFFYVNTGLLMAADNEAELAGVMAHEIAHVAARHATKNATKGDIFNLASIPLIFVGGPAGMAVRNVASIAGPMSFLKFSRDAEREADLLGIEYAYATGYDPRAMIDLFERLDSNTGSKQPKKHPNVLAKAFATHPMNSERIDRAQQEIALLLPPKDSYVETTSEFDQIKARLQNLQGPSRMQINVQTGKPKLRVKDQAEAAARNNAPVPPSGQTQQKTDDTTSDSGPVLRKRDGSAAPPKAN
ncbi:MAG TPA: M48 family metallopeptidase [Terriglobales bacterium]